MLLILCMGGSFGLSSKRAFSRDRQIEKSMGQIDPLPSVMKWLMINFIDLTLHLSLVGKFQHLRVGLS